MIMTESEQDDEPDRAARQPGRGAAPVSGTEPPGSAAVRPPPGRTGALSVRPGYEVGYAKPPVAGRFVKGQSGNPRGRPKGAKNKIPALHEQRMRAIILEEAYRTITVRDGARNVTVPIAQAVLRSLAVNAVKGQHRSQRLFSELLSAVEAGNKALHEAYFDSALTYKLAWTKELDRRYKFGITDLPDPIPHPDHIRLNMNLGTVEILGPLTAEDKVKLEYWRDQKVVVRTAVEALRGQLGIEEDPDELADILRHIKIGEDLLARLERDLPE
jgi:hypothetical protein